MIYFFLSLCFENQSFADSRSVIHKLAQPEVCGFELANASPSISLSEAQAGIPSEGGRGNTQKASVTFLFFKWVIIKIKSLVLFIKKKINVIHNYNQRENLWSL